MSKAEDIARKAFQEFNNRFANIIQTHQRKDWLRTSQAADYLNVSESQLHKLRSENILPYTKLGGTIYFDRKDIDDILERNKNNVE